MEYEFKKLTTRKYFESFHPFTTTTQDTTHEVKTEISVFVICGKGKCF